MASPSSSSTKQQSSLFSSFKVFKFTSSKPPRPPPKDPGYIYSASCNPSLVSVSNHSLYSQPPLPSSSSSTRSPKGKTKANGAVSIRSASPTPSRTLQSSPQHCPQQRQPPSSLSASSTLMPESSLGSGKVGFFRKISTLGKRSASKSPRVTTTDDVGDAESISRPWNVQVSPLLSSLLPVLGLNFLKPSIFSLSRPRNVRLHALLR
jgi:hypothetical protein